MMEVIAAKSERRPPSLLNARRWCLQPDQWEKHPDGETETLIGGVKINAQKAFAEGGQLADLASGFIDEDANQKEQKSVLSTLRTQTEFLVSKPIARDVEKGNWSFAQLRTAPTKVYIVVPPHQSQDKHRWLRMLITSALCEHLRPGPYRTLFILDEFRASIGNLQIVNDFWSLVRGCGVSFMPVCQSALQLEKLFGTEWENYAAQSGAVVTIGAPGDLKTAKWMSERAGQTTEYRQGWNEGEGTSAGGVSSSIGETVSETEKAFKTPNELMSMLPGTGRIWTPGEGTKSIPFYAREYWKCRELQGLYDPNPYVEGVAAQSFVSARASASVPSSGARPWGAAPSNPVPVNGVAPPARDPENLPRMSRNAKLFTWAMFIAAALMYFLVPEHPSATASKPVSSQSTAKAPAQHHHR
jgi:type IV secretory pathway TraG/TraD family ATPase VirD4